RASTSNVDHEKWNLQSGESRSRGAGRRLCVRIRIHLHSAEVERRSGSAGESDRGPLIRPAFCHCELPRPLGNWSCGCLVSTVRRADSSPAESRFGMTKGKGAVSSETQLNLTDRLN